MNWGWFFGVRAASWKLLPKLNLLAFSSALKSRCRHIRSRTLQRLHCWSERIQRKKLRPQLPNGARTPLSAITTNCGRSILAVTENPHHLRLLTGVLTGEGYAVRPVESGKAALAIVNIEPPDLILLDISTARLNGLEIYSQLKVGTLTRHIPIILLSRPNQMDQAVECLRFEATDYMTAPWRRGELLARIRTQLNLRTLKTRLEHLVAQRTLALTAANEALRRELAESERARMLLSENHERFRNIADDAPVIIWAAGPKQEPEFFNKQASLLTGRTAADLRRDGWRASIHPADLAQRDAIYVAALKNREAFQMEYRLRVADGTYRQAFSIGVPRTIENCFAGHLGIVIDISVLKRIQEQVLVTRKMESVAALAGGIAHDFNNLVSAILGETDLALAEVPDRSPARNNLERINEIAMRASEIVRLLMTYAAHDRGQAELVDLGSLITGMILPLKASISKKAALHTELSEDVPPVLANPVQIRQVMVNLITNASEALEGQAGAIVVSTSRISSGFESNRRASEPYQSGDYVRLAVTDTGCGIANETLAKVFDPFYTTKFLGRGLGLAVVQGIVRAHQGLINVSSTPGEGSTFEILFPCHERHPTQVRPSSFQNETAVCAETVAEIIRED
jgi:PAS domain S-box-containing protein